MMAEILLDLDGFLVSVAAKGWGERVSQAPLHVFRHKATCK